METRYIGIDPGFSGAIAIITDAGIEKVIDMPTKFKPGTKKSMLDENALANFFWEYADQPNTYAEMEFVQGLPGEGAARSFQFGYSVGVVRGMLSVSRIPYKLVGPTAWKNFHGIAPKLSKATNIEIARKLFPAADLRFLKHSGRADALLIAEHCREVVKRG